jgi:hypothetical protein
VFSRSSLTWAMIISCVFTSVPTMRVVAKFVFKSSTPWRPWDKVASRWAASSTLGALQHSLSPFNMRLGHPASGRICQLTLMDRLISSSSYSATQSGASWPTSFRWLQRESLAGGSGSCPRNPSRLGKVSASASLTSSLPWGQNLRTHRSLQPSAAPSPENKKLRLGAWGLWCPAFS